MDWFLVLCAAAVIAVGLVAGVFLAFSDFVMKSLIAVTPKGGIESMQLINRKVYGSKFLVLLLGMAPVSLFLAGYAYMRMSGLAAAWIIAGGAIYVIGVFVVTMICNVPMNQRLDRMDYTGTEAGAYWPTYVSSWTWWNHVRTIASFGSAVCFFVGCLLLVQG